MTTLALADRIRKAPLGVTPKQAAVKLVEEGQASAEDAFLAWIAAKILNAPTCEVCGSTLTEDEARVGVLCKGCHDEMFHDRHVPIAYPG